MYLRTACSLFLLIILYSLVIFIKIICNICVIIYLKQSITTKTAPTTSPPPLSTCESLDGMHRREEPVQRQQQEGVQAGVGGHVDQVLDHLTPHLAWVGRRG